MLGTFDGARLRRLGIVLPKRRPRRIVYRTYPRAARLAVRCQGITLLV